MIDEGIYDEWNVQKKTLASKDRRFLFKEGEVWWCVLGINLGTECFGKSAAFTRPVLVVRKLSKDSCVILPLTSVPKVGTWFSEINLLNKKNWVLLAQIRMVHVKRFQRRIIAIPAEDFRNIKRKLEQLLKLS